MDAIARKLSLFFFAGILCTSMLVLSGCAKYQPQTLSIPTITPEEKDQLEVTAQALTESECRKAFSRRILNKQYQPIQLVIKNKSRDTYILDAANIELQIEPVHLVAKRLHVNTAGRVISWAAGGLFFWPFYITAIVEGCKSSEANKELSQDLEHRAMSDDSRIIIHPGSMINKVFFVTEEHYRSKFKINLLNKETDDLVTFKMRI